MDRERVFSPPERSRRQLSQSITFKKQVSSTFKAFEYPEIDLNDERGVSEFRQILSENGDLTTLNKLNK